MNSIRLREILEEYATGDAVDMSGVEELIKGEKPNRLKLARDKYKKQAADGKADESMSTADWISYKSRQEVERWEAKMRAAAEYEPYVVEQGASEVQPDCQATEYHRRVACLAALGEAYQDLHS